MDEDTFCGRDAKGRFLKGAPSANPRGAPPKRARASNLTEGLDPMAALVLRVSRLTRTKADGSSPTHLEDALERLYSVGMIEGDTKALTEFIRITAAAGAVEKEYFNKMLVHAIEYKNYWGPIFDRAEQAGLKAPRQLPHPDDIIIDPEGNVQIVGPTDYEDKKKQDAVLYLRDAHLDALRVTSDNEVEPEAARKAIQYLKRRLARLNRALPPRLRRQA
jgi:hypothetical protein